MIFDKFILVYKSDNKAKIWTLVKAKVKIQKTINVKV